MQPAPSPFCGLAAGRGVALGALGALVGFGVFFAVTGLATGRGVAFAESFAATGFFVGLGVVGFLVGL